MRESKRVYTQLDNTSVYLYRASQNNGKDHVIVKEEPTRLNNQVGKQVVDTSAGPDKKGQNK